MAKKLTARQAKFVEVYLSNGRNAADAYRQAYNTTMPSNRCSAEAKKMLNSPKLLPYLTRAEAKAERAIERAAETYAVSRERNIVELARMAYANIEDYTRLTPDGERVVDFSSASREQLAAVQEIVVEDFKDGRGEEARDVRRVKFKLADKQGAIERINKMFGWVIDRSELGKPGDFANLSTDEVEQELVAKLVERGMTEKAAWALVKEQRAAGAAQ